MKWLIAIGVLAGIAIPVWAQQSPASLPEEQSLVEDFAAMENSMNAATVAKKHLAEDIAALLQKYHWYKAWTEGTLLQLDKKDDASNPKN